MSNGGDFVLAKRKQKTEQHKETKKKTQLKNQGEIIRRMKLKK
jgi:hypothetical protein